MRNEIGAAARVAKDGAAEISREPCVAGLKAGLKAGLTSGPAEAARPLVSVGKKTVGRAPRASA
ncbi:hypothetical protein B0G82_1585 [Paraburkholderia sp. BL17N1]|nr:hypothetical protein B0G82_1585 [Paraburkholderia sp. BL17N1]